MPSYCVCVLRGKNTMKKKDRGDSASNSVVHQPLCDYQCSLDSIHKFCDSLSLSMVMESCFSNMPQRPIFLIQHASGTLSSQSQFETVLKNAIVQSRGASIRIFDEKHTHFHFNYKPPILWAFPFRILLYRKALCRQ